MFFILFLIVFMYSCEDELNSPSEDSFLPQEGCTDQIAFNHDLRANIDDGTCIYNSVENADYENCIDGGWSHHTCLNPEDDSVAQDWNGSENTCNELGYIYTAGSCSATSDLRIKDSQIMKLMIGQIFKQNKFLNNRSPLL